MRRLSQYCVMALTSSALTAVRRRDQTGEAPVSGIDCHNSQTLALRVTRPAFIEGMRALKASQGINDYDVGDDYQQEHIAG